MSDHDLPLPPPRSPAGAAPAWLPADLSRWESPRARTRVAVVGWACFAIGLLILLGGLVDGQRGTKLMGLAFAVAGHAMVAAKRVIAAKLEGREARPTVVGRGWSRVRRLPMWGQGALAVLALIMILGGTSTPEAAPVLIADSEAGDDPSDEPTLEPTEEPTPEPIEEPTEEPTADATEEPTERPTPVPTAEPSDEPVVTTPVEAAAWTVTNVVDGDTIDVTAAAGGTERVRIIGIDTPERGECGFGEASAALSALVEGKTVELVGGARDDRDRYDRILRYVDSDGVDAGLELINAGYAIARYDSRDGYGHHPREDAYIAAEGASTPTCAAPAPPPEPEPEPEPAPAPPPPASGPGSGPGGAWKNCSEARDHGAAPVYRGDPGYGPHLDRDDDGIGCE